jgi:uncharacterized protein (TIGR02246 family)
VRFALALVSVITLAPAPLTGGGVHQAPPDKLRPGPEGLAATLTDLEKKTWAALQGRDAEAIKALWADDFVGVLASGLRRGKAEILKTLPDLTITSYELEEPRAVPLAPGATLLTYRLNRRSTFKGRELPPACYASSVWVRRDGRWRIAFYQETPISK